MNLAKLALNLTDNATVKKAAIQLEEVAYSANQLLTPDSLKTVETRELRAAFIKAALQHIYSLKSVDDINKMKTKTAVLENRAIGGGLL